MEHNRVIYTRPYDAEVEYLESTGTQFIDTGIIGNQNTEIRIKFYITEFIKNTIYFGARTMFNSSDALVFGISSSNNWYISFGSKALSSSTTILPQEDYEVILNKNICIINNQTLSTYNSADFNTPSTLILFGYHSRDNVSKQSYRTYYLKIYDNNTLVRDLIPVRKGSIGYLYDKVSKKLFANKGTGNFILGQDVANPVPNIRRVFRFNNKRFVMPMPYDSKIEYLESNGTQYIDTGIKPIASTFGFEGVFMYTSNANMTKGVFGCRYSTGVTNQSYNCFVVNNRLRADTTSIKDSYLNISYNTSIKYTYSPQQTIVNNTTLTNATKVNCGVTFCLFDFRQPSGMYGGAPVRIYNWKIYSSNTLIMDLIPVRRGNVGYLYDKVSGKLFGNAGTGQFILGNDIND